MAALSFFGRQASNVRVKKLRLHRVRLQFPMDSIGISIDPAVCHGKPVIEGTRVLVSTVLGALAGGDSREMVAEDYSLTLEQISAALQFASDIADFQGSAYEAVA